METSQRVVDVLLGALGVAAASQGTMNNLTFGDATFGYYETICGGSGATAEADGADAVHTHMTNTRLTDPEIIERRYPVRISIPHRAGVGGPWAPSRQAMVLCGQIEFFGLLSRSRCCPSRRPVRPFRPRGRRRRALGRNRLGGQARIRIERFPGGKFALEVADGDG